MAVLTHLFKFVFIFYLTAVQCQLNLPTGFSLDQFCMAGFENHGRSCYRYMNLEAPWAEAWTYCQTIASHPVSIETAGENVFLTDFVVKHTSNSSTSSNLEKRIWTDGNNFLGIHRWTSSKSHFSYTAWHTGEPYLATSDTVFCVMKMGASWFADDCSHKRKFVCEMEIDGVVFPNPTTTGKPNDKILG